MLKIITFLISKEESRLSKKNKCFFSRITENPKIQLYRELLNIIDAYINKTTEKRIYRHFRYVALDDLFNGEK